MKCDQCEKEANDGVGQEWIGVGIASTSTYGADSGPFTVTETTYEAFTSIPTFLCVACYEPRGRKARRNARSVLLLGLVGIGLFILAYLFLVSDRDLPIATFWRNVSGLLAVLVGFLFVKFAWRELNLRGELLWKIDTGMERHDVLHPYAHKKGREIGCAQVWDIETFTSMSRSNQRMNEQDRLLSLWEKGVITEAEYRKRLMRVYEDR